MDYILMTAGRRGVWMECQNKLIGNIAETIHHKLSEQKSINGYLFICKKKRQDALGVVFGMSLNSALKNVNDMPILPASLSFNRICFTSNHTIEEITVAFKQLLQTLLVNNQNKRLAL